MGCRGDNERENQPNKMELKREHQNARTTAVDETSEVLTDYLITAKDPVDIRQRPLSISH